MAQIHEDVRTIHQHVGTENFAVGAIFLAFLVYITAKGELGTYLQLFFYAPPAAPAPGATNAAASSSNTSGATAGQAVPGLSLNPFNFGSNPFGLGPGVNILGTNPNSAPQTYNPVLTN